MSQTVLIADVRPGWVSAEGEKQVKVQQLRRMVSLEKLLKEQLDSPVFSLQFRERLLLCTLLLGPNIHISVSVLTEMKVTNQL